MLAAPLALGAQEVVTLDQSLGLSVNQSTVSLVDYKASNMTTLAQYQFELGMPILAYRLGALSIGGALGFQKQKDSEIGTDSAFGLSTLGVSGSLFPYQPYHVSFDYSHTKAPDLFGGGSQTGQTFGLGLLYRGDLLQNVRVAFRHGSISGASGGGSYSSWTFSDNERRGATDLHVNIDRQDASFSSGSTWRSTALTANSQTKLRGSWMMSNNLSSQVYQGSTFVQAGSALTGSYGPWTSMSSLDLNHSKTENQTSSSGGLSQSLARSWSRVSLFTQAGLSGGVSSGPGGVTNLMANLSLGGTFKLSQGWHLMGDVSGAASGRRKDGAFVSTGQGLTRSMHVGLNWGGGIPDLLRHALYYWTNLRFQRQLREDYPPDYLPPEILKVQERRRHEQQGSLQFSSDFYRVQHGGPGHQDWFRVQGGLRFGNGLMLQTIGDLRKEDRFSNPNRITRDAHVMTHGAFSLGRTSINFGVGMSKSTIHQDAPGPSVPGDDLDLPRSPLKVIKFFSLGLNSFVAGMPVGITALRNNDALGIVTRSLLTYAARSYGKVSFNINYQRGWRSDGLRTSQITVNLGRWFDTLPVWGVGE